MPTHAEQLGLRVAEARRRANLTQSELAAEARLERTALAKIERGQRNVSALELVDLASALGMRPEWLLSDAPSAIIAHRTRLDGDLEILAIDDQLEGLARDVSALARLDDALISNPLSAEPVPQSNSSTEELAQKARHQAGLESGDRAHDLSAVVANVGMLAFSSPLGPDTADAASTLVAGGAVALINSSSDVGRRRIALAHELGHYLLHDEYARDWRVVAHSDSDRVEVVLDRFARAFLAPQDDFAEFWESARRDYDLRTSAVLTGNSFGVDMSTIARRLLELRIETPDTARAVRSFHTGRADIVEFGFLPPKDLEGTTVSPQYAKSVLGLYRRERLSSDRTVQLLRGTLTRDDLPPLRTVHRDEIWSLLS